MEKVNVHLQVEMNILKRWREKDKAILKNLEIKKEDQIFVKW